MPEQVCVHYITGQVTYGICKAVWSIDSNKVMQSTIHGMYLLSCIVDSVH